MNATWRVFACVLVVVGLWSSGCSNGGSGSIPRERYAAELVAAACEGIAPCCDEDGYAYDEEGCRANRNYVYVPSPELAVAYDAKAAGDCVAELRAAGNRCGGVGFSPAACLEVFRPTRQAGESCTSYEECIGGPPWGVGICAPVAPGGASVCLAEPPTVRAREGDACGATCEAFGEQSFCGYQFARAGACFIEDGVRCSHESGTCVRLGTSGDACDNLRLPCADGYFCSSLSCSDGTIESCRGRCEPTIPVGEECGFEFDACADGARCVGVDCAATQDGVAAPTSCRYECRPWRDAGESCDPALAFDCTPDLFCSTDTGICESLRREGESCSLPEAFCEYDLLCDVESGACKARRELGAPCTSNYDCASFACTADPGWGFDHAAQQRDGVGTCRPPRTTDPYACGASYSSPVPTPVDGLAGR